MTAEILTASEKMTGTVRGLRRIDIQRGAIDERWKESARTFLYTASSITASLGASVNTLETVESGRPSDESRTRHDPLS